MSNAPTLLLPIVNSDESFLVTRTICVKLAAKLALRHYSLLDSTLFFTSLPHIPITKFNYDRISDLTESSVNLDFRMRQYSLAR